MLAKVWLKPPGLFELVMKRRNLLISLKPVKSGLVQEIPRELVVSESGMIWRLVAVPGGTVGERERANKCLYYVKRIPEKVQVRESVPIIMGTRTSLSVPGSTSGATDGEREAVCMCGYV